MKKIISLLVSLVLIISFLIGGSISLILEKKNTVNSAKKTSLPKITLKNMQNEKINLEQIDKATLLFFWLPQSKSCLQQLEILDNLHLKYKNKINIFAIGIGNLNKSQIKDIINKKQLSYSILIDAKTELTEKIKVTTIPTIVFYSPYHQITRIVGLKREEELENIIKEILINPTNK